MQKIIAFDLDDVLCFREPCYESLGRDKYNYCKPIVSNIELLNKCYDEGFYIKIYTARGMMVYNKNLDLILKELFILTEKQLHSWGVKYHELIFGKTHYHLLIDDKVKNISDIKSLEDIKKFVGQ